MIIQKINDPIAPLDFENKLVRAHQFLLKTDFGSMPAGRIEIDGNDLFAVVQHYSTDDFQNIRFENHEKYADLQYIVFGEESIFVCHRDDAGSVATPYDAEEDIAFYGDPVSVPTELRMDAGDCAVFFPEDFHKTRCSIRQGCPVDVCKVIVKIRL